jgi:hypothetical protein
MMGLFVSLALSFHSNYTVGSGSALVPRLPAARYEIGEKIMTVIEHDFGKKDRETIKRFTKLTTLEAQHEANVLANPIPYLERADERISQLEMALLEAVRAAPDKQTEPGAEKIEVDRAEYERLLQCRDIIAKTLTRLGIT